MERYTMKNRSLLYWVRETFKILGITIGVSLLYSTFMGYMQYDREELGHGIGILCNYIAAGFPYYLVMEFVFLARYALDAAMRQIPLCISYGETRRSVLCNQQLSVLILLVVTVLVLCAQLFLIVPASTAAADLSGFLENPVWSFCVIVVLCIIPLSFSQIGCAFSIKTEGRSNTWIMLLIIFGAAILGVGAFTIGILFVDTLYGNWNVLLGVFGVSAVLYGIGFFWLKSLLKNYRVSL